MGVRTTIKLFLQNLPYTVLKVEYLPMLEFLTFSCLGTVYFVWAGFKKRSGKLFLLYVGLLCAVFGIHAVIGMITYRAGQTLCFFAGFLSLLFAHTLSQYGKAGKGIAAALAVWLIFIQCANLNLSFYTDYRRYQKEAFAVHTIATKLVAECDISKPVVFTNRPSGGYLNVASSGGQTIGNSVIYWGVGTFNEVRSYEMLEFFSMCGYDFLVVPTKEQAERGAALSEGMPPFPEEGYIREFDDLIVVNFGTE